MLTSGYRFGTGERARESEANPAGPAAGRGAGVTRIGRYVNAVDRKRRREMYPADEDDDGGAKCLSVRTNTAVAEDGITTIDQAGARGKRFLSSRKTSAQRVNKNGRWNVKNNHQVLSNALALAGPGLVLVRT